jgi:hypothetical protein
MRTTLDLEEDVLLRAKELARRRGVSIGKVISDLVRQALARSENSTMRNGVPLFPLQPDAQIVTPELVDDIRSAHSCQRG